MSERTDIRELPLGVIKHESRLQPRVLSSPQTIQRYQEALEDGKVFPPIGVVEVEGEYWMYDGYHRFWAHEKAGAETIRAEVRPGSIEDAILLAAGANAEHGLPRQAGDERKAVFDVLDLKDGKVSEAKLGEIVHITVYHARRYRAEWDRAQNRERPRGSYYQGDVLVERPNYQFPERRHSDQVPPERTPTQSTPESQPEHETATAVAESEVYESVFESAPVDEPAVSPNGPARPAYVPEPREVVRLRLAVRDLRIWRRRYNDVPEVAHIVAAIDALAELE